MSDTRLYSSRGLLVLPLLSILVLATLQPSLASEELLKNGSFEEGNFDGWTAVGSSVRTHSTTGGQYEPAHLGRYSARIGTESVEGRISQAVSIPRKSAGKFTAWYRVEDGSSLTIFLKDSNGSIIQQWGITIVTSWTLVSHDLDVSYAGQSVTVEFVGVGHRERITTTDYEYYYDPVTGTWVPYPVVRESHNDYWPYVDDVSLTYDIVLYETAVSVAGLPQELSTKLTIDANAAQSTMISGEQSETLPFRIGETHKITVERFVYKDNTTRYYCSSNSTTVSSDGQITFSYKPQYYLSVASPYGETAGSGWYDEDTEASFSLDRTTSPVPDFTGALGAEYVFVKWSDNATGNSINGKTLMDRPKSITAVWSTDNSILYLSIGIIVCASIGGVAGTYLTLRGKKKSLRLPFKKPADAAVTQPETRGESNRITLRVSAKRQKPPSRFDTL